MGNLWFAGYRASSRAQITQHTREGGVHGQVRALAQEGEAGLELSLLIGKWVSLRNWKRLLTTSLRGRQKPAKFRDFSGSSEEAGGWRMKRDSRRAVPAGRGVRRGVSSRCFSLGDLQ